MEEAIWILSPIAVAVLAYLLDVRQARRYELEADSIKERMRGLELAHVSGFADKDLRLQLHDKTLEYLEGRIATLEGAESGLPKEDGDKIHKRLDNAEYNIGNLAINQRELTVKVEGLKAEPVVEE